MTNDDYDKLLSQQGSGWRKTLGMDEPQPVDTENGFRWVSRGGFAGEWEPLPSPPQAANPSDQEIRDAINGDI